MAAALDAFLAEAPDSHLLIRAWQPPEPGKYDRVAVAVRDRAELRALALPKGVRTAALAVWLEEGTSALGLSPRPEWPALESMESGRVDGGWLTVLRFEARVGVHVVVGELARQSVWPDRFGDRGLVVHEPATPVAAKVPPDVLLADWHMGWGETELPVTGRTPLLATRAEAPLGPLDERVLNPIGFDPDATGPVVDLHVEARVTESLVRSLRPALGVRVQSGAPADLLAGLAMAGVPLTAASLDPEAAAKLGDPVSAAINAPVDLADPLAREEHSVVLRRAALNEFSSSAWRRKLGERAGVRVHWQPPVSVVMATRRPDLLEHALGQVARQRGVERLELVLAPHGFEPDSGRVRELAGDSVSVEIVAQPSETMFGDVLQAAALRTSGDVVLKMDDDDWYSPDFVTDLLLARAYSGAELVGTTDEFYFLEDRDQTVRLGQPSERYTNFVAGGTMLLDRTLLQNVGGFRSVRRHVDAQLIHAVRAAGGAVYRTHGLGYCLRRSTSGHTWAADLDLLQARAANSWPGFRPSRLIES